MTVLMEMKDVHKHYPGVHALKGIRFRVEAGRVHALVGENGAGKSTLIKILGGVVPPESGEILIEGKSVRWRGPGDAIRAGIGIIHQELSLLLHLTVAQNVFLGREPALGPFVNRRKLREDTLRLLGDLGLDLDPDRPVKTLTTGEQQQVEIAKALSQKVRLLALDEPTSSLSSAETENLFRLIRDLKDKGVGMIYISHRLEEVKEIADEISVLRDGEYVGGGPAQDMSQEEIVSMMVGREMKTLFPEPRETFGNLVLETRDLCREGILRNLSLQLRQGEILALAGLVGSGRSELGRCLFGLDPFDGGEILLDGHPLVSMSPRQALGKGIILVPEDRKIQGLFLNMSIGVNITVVELLRSLGKRLFVDRKKQRARARELIDRLDVKCRGERERVGQLSGGNQQKVLFARGLSVSPRVLILDEPTRGIDVGAKAEIHRLMDDLARKGMAILMISSDLPEVLGMGDRIMVMREGQFVATFDRWEADSEKVMWAAAGGATS